MALSDTLTGPPAGYVDPETGAVNQNRSVDGEYFNVNGQWVSKDGTPYTGPAPTPTEIWASKLGMSMDQVNQLNSTPQGQAQWNSMVAQAQDKEAHAEDGFLGMPKGLQDALTLGGLGAGAGALLGGSAAAGATGTGVVSGSGGTLADVLAGNSGGALTGADYADMSLGDALTQNAANAAAGIGPTSDAALTAGAAGAGAAAGTAAGTTGAATGTATGAGITPTDAAVATTGAAAATGVNTGNTSDTAPAPDPNPDGPVIGSPDPHGGDITGSTTIDPKTGLPIVVPSGTTDPNKAIGKYTLDDLLSGKVGIDDVLKGTSLSDLSKLLGTIGSTALSAYGTNEAANKLKAISDQYMAIGAPSRQRYEDSFAPGFDINSMPGFTNALNTSRDAVLRKFSTSGDPFGNPGQLTEAMNYLSGNLALPALNNYRNQNAATGGFGAFSTSAPSTATNAVGAGIGPYTSIASGAADIFNPPQSLSDILNRPRKSYEDGFTYPRGP